MEKSRKNFSCSYCMESFLFETTLKLHLQKIHRIKSAETKILNKISEKVSEAVGQGVSLTVSPSNNPSKIISIEKETPSSILKTLCKKRSRTHHKCSQCSFSTNNFLLCQAHEKLEHGQKVIPVFYCSYSNCWFPFKTLREKLAHEKGKHGNIRAPFQCILCKRRFREKNNHFTYHLKRCSKRKVYTCPCGDLCSFSTRKLGVLYKHVELRHNKSLDSYDKSTYVTQSISKREEEKDVLDEVDSNVCLEDDENGHTDVDMENDGEEIKIEPLESSPDKMVMIHKENIEQAFQDVKASLECPFDRLKFPSADQLHKHIHANHLDTGYDSLNCPFCEEAWTCFCGRMTNNRDSLVLHSIRCDVILSAVSKDSRLSHHDEEGREIGNLIYRRRAARKLREMGFGGDLSDKDTEKLDQLKMLDALSNPKAKNSVIDDEEETLETIEVSDEEPVIKFEIKVLPESQGRASKRKRGTIANTTSFEINSPIKKVHHINSKNVKSYEVKKKQMTSPASIGIKLKKCLDCKGLCVKTSMTNIECPKSNR